VPLNIYVSFHDVANDSRVHSGGRGASHRGSGVSAQFIGPVGAEPTRSARSRRCDQMDGLAISSVSSDALAPLIDRVVARASR